MDYRGLGRTGVQVSQLCFGTMSFGGDADKAAYYEENLARYAEATGVDLRQVQDAAVACYAEAAGDVTLYLARHSGEVHHAPVG